MSAMEDALLDRAIRDRRAAIDELNSLRKEILDHPEWIGWDTIFCYWCDNVQDEGHALDCIWARLHAEAV